MGELVAWCLLSCEKTVREGTLEYKEVSTMEAKSWETCSLGPKGTAGERKGHSSKLLCRDVVMSIHLHQSKYLVIPTQMIFPS